MDVVSGEIAYHSYANPEAMNTRKDISFFLSTPESKRNIQFVINAIAKRDSQAAKGNVQTFIQNLDGRFIIREQRGFYAIEYVSEYQESLYKVDKQSGKIYDETHTSLIPPPEQKNRKDKLVEIKK